MVAHLDEYAEDSQGTGRRLMDEMEFERRALPVDHVFRRSMEVVLDKFVVFTIEVQCHWSAVDRF
jgi:hypothetical protein